METWVIDFAGSCEIAAASRKEAEEKFWAYIASNQALPSNLYEIQGVDVRDYTHLMEGSIEWDM